MDTPNDLMREEKRRKVSEKQDWSNLCHDLLRPILESLSYLGFHRAKTVCSDWYSVWKTCVKRPLCPWRITYKGDPWMLFGPKEDKSYKTKLLGLLGESHCIATSGNWILVVDSCLNFYILNMLTHKRINLPLMDSPILRGKWNVIVQSRTLAILWINERTGDYVVAWSFNSHDLFSCKKGDDSWWNWNTYLKSKRPHLGFRDMAYRNSKLYLFAYDNHIKIADFSGDYPKEVIQENPYRDHPFHHCWKPWDWESASQIRIAIKKSGEVLIILRLIFRGTVECKYMFYVFEMNLESKKWERVYSIGDDEMLIFGHGVTIKAPVLDVGDGIKSDSICFVEPGANRPSTCGIFDLATSRISLRDLVFTQIKLSGFFQDDVLKTMSIGKF